MIRLIEDSNSPEEYRSYIIQWSERSGLYSIINSNHKVVGEAPNTKEAKERIDDLEDSNEESIEEIDDNYLLVGYPKDSKVKPLYYDGNGAFVNDANSAERSTYNSLVRLLPRIKKDFSDYKWDIRRM